MLAEVDDLSDDQGFGKSLKKLVWLYEEPDQEVLAHLRAKLGISEILAVILINRGIREHIEAFDFLEPTLRNLMPDPFLLKDMSKAVARIIKAIQDNEKITVFGDYDVDGATSTALLRRFFKDIGVDIDVYIPSRMSEGYGPNVEAFNKIKANGTKLIITVDCGTVSFDPIEHAVNIGMDVIIFDHHLSGAMLPNAIAVVNPNRIDETFPFKSLAAVSIAFLAATAIRAGLRKINYFKDKEEVDLIKYLDLVAMGTVCDVMFLHGVNRAFVRHGLHLIAKRSNLGLSVLSDVAKMDAAPQSYHLGFVLGPRINAGGRVGEGILGSDLLFTDDPHQALLIANRLEALNEERRAVENIILEEAINQIEQKQLYRQDIILVAGNGWHQGVLGILASRLKERYSRPAVVVSSVDGIGKGSARSIPGVDIGSLLAKAKQLKILQEGGGHAMAGGFTLEVDNIEMFYQFLLQNTFNMETLIDRVKEIKIDAILNISAINSELVRDISRASPFGNGNPAPRFAILQVKVVNLRAIGKIHLMIIISDNSTHKNDGNTLKCVLFKAAETEIGSVLSRSVGKTINIVGSIQENLYDPTKVDFIIEDASIVK